MNTPFLWKLCATIAVGTVMLFWLVDILTHHAELKMSFIKTEHQQQLIEYGEQAEQLFLNQGEQALAAWLEQLQKKEQTWAAVVESNIVPMAGSNLSEQFVEGFRLGRNVEWKIHLYFKENPIMDIPFSDDSYHFLIQLPQRMRPGHYYPYADLMLQIALPMALLILLSFILYRHVMSPLKKLEKATRQFSDGRYEVRVKSCLGSRDDEMTRLAETFDQMAEHTGKLILNQRQLLADLTHELRAPLSRLDIALDGMEQGRDFEASLQRLRQESITMREMMEDALTLAWLNTDAPIQNNQRVDLVELLEVIVEDARFEYPDRRLVTQFPKQALLENINMTALSHAFENIIRNALSYTPENKEVRVIVASEAQRVKIEIHDQGPGVPESLLDDIFRPFFRVESSSSSQQKQRSGFGMGLAIAQRQIIAAGGEVLACNHYDPLSGEISGLTITASIPMQCNECNDC